MTVTQIQPREQAGHPLRVLVGKNLKTLLEHDRWSERKAATRLGITQGYINRRTTGVTELSTSDIVMFADLLRMTPGALTDALLNSRTPDYKRESSHPAGELVTLETYRQKRA